MQAVLQDKVTEFQEWYRSRALFRSVGTHSPAVDLLIATIFTTGLSLKWSYAILEIFIAMVMATGIAVFLRQLFGNPAAAAGLIILSFVVLPLRGLHYFAANELALSLSLVLWGYMLRHGAQSRLPLLLGGWFAAMAVHPIGLVYLCVGLAMLFLSEGGPRAWIRYRLLTIAGSLLALAAGVQLLTAALPFLGMENAFSERGLNFSKGLVKNLTEIYDFLILMVHDGGIVVVLVGLLGFALARDKVLRRPVIAATVAVSLPLVASFFYYYPGYPGELFGRLLVPLVIVLAGASGALLAEYLRIGRRWAVRSVAGVAAVIFVALTAIPDYQLVIQNLNDRRQIIDEKPLAAKVAQFPDKTNIIYLNADITTNATLLAGGARFGALIGPILANTKNGKALILERRPAIIAITLPDWLNMHAAKGSSALGKRRYGMTITRRPIFHTWTRKTGASSASMSRPRKIDPRR